MEKVNKANVQKRLKELQKPKSKETNNDEILALENYLKLIDSISKLNIQITSAIIALDNKVIENIKR